MDDDVIAQFTAITSADASRAQQYLQVSDGDLQQAIQLYFENDGADMGAAPPAQPTQPPTGADPSDPVTIDSDDEGGGGVGLESSGVAAAESDEAMARRLQQEMYGAGGAAGGDLGADIDPETGVRRPMARQAETLAAPGGFRDEDELNDAIAAQMQSRQERRAFLRQGGARPGIFNQMHGEDTSSIWEEEAGDSSSSSSQQRRQRLSRATGGASEQNSKSSMLAEMYRPPTELISPIRTWEGVRAHGKEEAKWILINIQDSNIFDCQVLNRDIWKDAQIQATVREHFVFKQYGKHDPQAGQYVRYYFRDVDSDAAYPHIAIVDPRTGEQVKVWSGTPTPKAPDFLMQLHEFLDRYSLSAGARNPVATRRPDRPRERDPDRMTEDEQLQLAMRQSLTGGPGADDGHPAAAAPRSEDPDALTRAQESTTNNGAGGGAPGTSTPSTMDVDPPTTTGGPSPFFASIPSTPHAEPAAAAPGTTRVQFRHPGGRVIRRFGLAEPARALYEFLKAEAVSPLGAERTGAEFELVCMGRNLADAVAKDETVEAAGLKNGTVMVEFV